MPSRHLRVSETDGAALRAAFERLRADLEIPADFPPEVMAEAERVARAPLLPDDDATSIPFFTIDPPDSVDLDQAMHLRRRSSGYRVYYAIADVAAFLRPGGALDTEAHRRVTTLYFPDRRVPLHPAVLSEGAASLLPGKDRPALLWRFDLDHGGALVGTDVRRALVRSRAKLDYAGVQRAIDDGTAPEEVALLRDIGLLREELERSRGGISLNVPEQEIVPSGDGCEHYSLAYRGALPAEGWNAQISLLTGMAAADLMLQSGTGVLRTLPLAPDGAVARLRRVAGVLDVDWPHHTSYAEVIRSLDPRRGNHAAFLQECTTLLRGAGYTVFAGERPTRQAALHAAIADEYTHCTAPLRRLVDRYAGELCIAASAGREPPEWVHDALAGLPAVMASGSRRESTVERACLDLAEAAVLRDHLGEVFDACVVDIREDRPHEGTVHLVAPAVIGRVEAPADGPPLTLGARLRVRLLQADPGRERVRFTPA